MTQHSQNGEGVGPGWDEDGMCNDHGRYLCAECAIPARQSLAREPATADVGRESIHEEVRNLLESIKRPFPLNCNWEDQARACQVVAQQALDLIAAPSRGHAMAEGERDQCTSCDGTGYNPTPNRWPGRDCIACDGTGKESVRLNLHAAALATTPPTTNDAIPAGRRILIAKALARHPDSSWDDYEWEDMASFVQDRFLEQADLALAALSAAPSAPATEAGEEA